MKSLIVAKKYFKDGKPLTGFTLIELIVVFFIIAALSGIIVFNFSQIRNGLALTRAAHQLAQDIRGAQEMAMSAAELNASENCSSPPPAKGYGIYIDRWSSAISYKLYADTSDDGGSYGYYTEADCIVKTIDVAESLIYIKAIYNIEGNPGTASINFSPPNPNTEIKDLMADKDEVEIILGLENDVSDIKTVTVNRAGVVEIK